LESRRRIERLLDVVENRWLKLRMVRAIEAVERCGTAAARELLRQLAKNTVSVKRAAEAEAALLRLQVAGE
jgi:hypothetical protein